MKTFLLCLAGAAAFALQARADEPAIIAKARAYLGSEDALNGVRTIHMVGTVTGTDSSDPKNPTVAHVDIVFERPWRESMTIIQKDRITHTALDGYDGWSQEQPVTPGQTSINPNARSSLTLLGPPQIRGLRADTFENLNYYRGFDAIGGSVVDRGPATIDGTACERVDLIHDSDIVYHRYFDLSTGRLVYTETEAGAKIRESGEIDAGGIRFPKTIVAVQKDSKGGDLTTSYTFDSVTVNETFPDSLFKVPMPLPVDLPSSAPGGATGVPPAPASPSAPATPAAPAAPAPQP